MSRGERPFPFQCGLDLANPLMMDSSAVPPVNYPYSMVGPIHTVSSAVCRMSGLGFFALQDRVGHRSLACPLVTPNPSCTAATSPSREYPYFPFSLTLHDFPRLGNVHHIRLRLYQLDLEKGQFDNSLTVLLLLYQLYLAYLSNICTILLLFDK